MGEVIFLIRSHEYLNNTFLFVGLEIFRQLPGQSKSKFPHIEEFSYSTDRNYFCQPYIGFVPETNEYRNVRKGKQKQLILVGFRALKSYIIPCINISSSY